MKQEITVGKRLGKTVYVHTSSRGSWPDRWMERVHAASATANVELDLPWNVVKLNLEEQRVSFLFYRQFWDDPFPALDMACAVNLSSGVVQLRKYRASRNPPILHRKELLLDRNEPRRARFARLTSELEDRGMFRDCKQIGFRCQWASRLREEGFVIRDYRVIEKTHALSDESVPPW